MTEPAGDGAGVRAGGDASPGADPGSGPGPIVIKVGGDVFATGVVHAVAVDVGALVGTGQAVVMVHGGGPQATAMQRALGQEPNVVAGRRITDEPTLDVMKMVVGGKLNIDLCAALLAAGARPVGLTGASALTVEAARRPPRPVSGGGPDPVDFGLVGDVTGINRDLLALLTGARYTPVVACLGASPAGVVLNINADAVAVQLAAAVRARHLVLVTGTPGVLRDVDDPSSRIPTMTTAEARAAIHDGLASGGMIPKLDESIRAVASGLVGSVHIVGRVKPGDLMREIQTPGAVGTALVP